MENKKWTRRQILGSFAVLPLTANAAISSVSKVVLGSSKLTRCKLLNSKGEPYKVKKMDRFHICDLISRPFQIDPQFAPGEIVFAPVTTPFRISLPIEVPGFGEVFCYADNRGKGYTAEALEKINNLFLNYEFAADRIATVHRIMEECRQSGINLSSAALNRVTAAEKFLAKSDEAQADDKTVSKWAMESLCESLWAGEMIVVEMAKQAIERRGARSGFLFGCNGFRYSKYGKPYADYFESLFNFATLPFYQGGIEPVKGQPDYSRVDKLLVWLQNTQIKYKGHPLVWLNVGTFQTPEWAKNKPFEETKESCLKFVRNSVLKYRSRIHVWDIINEAHVQPETGLGMAGFTKEQNVELTCASAKTAREADPTCFRIVNNTGTWSDYYMGRKPAVWQENVYEYLQMIEDVKCDYEAIGLQYYHSGRDLLEFERDVERFARFKKPIHITELQIPSSSAEIPGAEWWGGGVGGSRFPWHGTEFTETIQADWVESVYTMLYSKPYIDAITWWDLADPAFVPHGGLINANMKPKESYFRLKSLLDKWKSIT
ncbi:MAG: endo-1,4-beta-xylanase [Bacteroidales bacterium]|nr:endo-1,4-beta-xylanase [Bacteroidales bacterium]